MAEYKSDMNTKKFQIAVKLAKLRFPVTEIAKMLDYSKGNVSDLKSCAH